MPRQGRRHYLPEPAERVLCNRRTSIVQMVVAEEWRVTCIDCKRRLAQRRAAAESDAESVCARSDAGARDSVRA
jgi:hypothetical protein